MNKRGLIKLVFISIAFFFPILLTLINDGIASLFNLIGILDLILSISIFMYSNRKSVKKYNFIYNVINLLLIVISICYVSFVAFSYIVCNFSPECGINLGNVIGVFYLVPLFLILLYSFQDVFNKTNKTNDLLSILVSIVSIMIYLKYYREYNFLSSYDYISQNYIYLYTMYLLLLIHYKLNKQES